MTEFTQIQYAVADGIATITMHRPEKMNAFTNVMMREMCTAFDLVDADDAVRAVIVTGSGERAFCAGADLTPDAGGDVFASRSEVESLSDERVRDSGGRLTLRIFNAKNPLSAPSTALRWALARLCNCQWISVWRATLHASALSLHGAGLCQRRPLVGSCRAWLACNRPWNGA